MALIVTSTTQHVIQSTPRSLPFSTVNAKTFANDTNNATTEATSVRLATSWSLDAFQSTLNPRPALINGFTNKTVMYMLKI